MLIMMELAATIAFGKHITDRQGREVLQYTPKTKQDFVKRHNIAS